MTAEIGLQATRCAICGTEDNSTELYPANFDDQSFSPAVFSARRLPDRIHYRLVRCSACGLVRSDPVADARVLAKLYRESTLDYSEEIPNLKRTYGRYLAALGTPGAKKGALLEIGCGNGFFLEEARARGYGEVRGVEPSASAVEKAAPDLRPDIVCDVMKPGLFPPGTFDVICLFQTLDHIPDPRGLLAECFRLLAPGGKILCVNHDAEAFSARILKERSPIVDIEHTYLFSCETARRLFSACGFRVLETGAAVNRYSLYYLVRFVPVPGGIKSAVLSFLKATGLGSVPLSVPLGNLYLVAQKPGN